MSKRQSKLPKKAAAKLRLLSFFCVFDFLFFFRVGKINKRQIAVPQEVK